MKRILTVLLFWAALTPFAGTAQCKNFTKKKCMPSLSPYVTNGQINTAMFVPGDKAEIPLSFFENTSYRIIVCNQEIIGNIVFKVLDANKNVLFDNKGVGYVSSWDFKSVSNQSLTLYVEIPPEDGKNPNNLVHQGCVSIIVGFKKS